MWTEHVWILSFVSVLAGNFSHWLFILEMFLCRSIRALCNSWDTFAKIAVGEKVCDQLSSKKRKVLPDSSDVQAPCLIPSLEKAHSSLENRGTDRNNGLEYQQAEHQFNRAEKCLFSLKDSIESLHQKKLFPYNPEALLKRYLQLRFFCSLFRLVFVTYVKPLFYVVCHLVYICTLTSCSFKISTSWSIPLCSSLHIHIPKWTVSSECLLILLYLVGLVCSLTRFQHMCFETEKQDHPE